MNIENAKEILLGFMQEMYEWEKKATKSLRSLDYENTLRLELSLIFSKYCTPKKSKRTREISLSVRFPFEYKPETHPIIDVKEENKYLFFYIEENRSGLKTQYRYRLVYKNEKWWIDKKEWFTQAKWENCSF